jgi:hypothetical protein
VLRLPQADRTRRVALAGALALALAACGGGGDAGVGMENLTSDIVFGAQGSDVAAPANFNPPPVSASQAASNLDLPDQFFEPVTQAPKPRPALRAEVECPEAALNEFPDRSADLNIPLDPVALPREGSYQWRKAGTLMQEEIDRPVAVDGFERRLIRNVEVVSETKDDEDKTTAITFSYETVQPAIGTNDVVVTTYQVKTNGTRPRVFSPSGEDEVSTGDPEAGLTLKAVEVFDASGSRVSSFNPPVGLLLLPLRVVPGSEHQATAVDPRTRTQMTIGAAVIKRDRVDACGEIVEGWRVESTLTVNSPDGNFVRDYTYFVATQYGGVLIFEHIGESGSDLELTYTLGQQDPDPLPEGNEEGTT